MASPEQLIAVVNVLGNVVRSIQLKRVLTDVDPDPPLNFWRVLYGNLFDIAVLDWCKLFGSDDEAHQQVHWKNVIADGRQQEFRAGLLAHLGIGANAWAEYWNHMKTYRDQHVAHLDFKSRDLTHYPMLDHALESSYFYYAAVIAELRKQNVTRYPDDLRAYSAAFADQARTIAVRALASTKGIEEKVY
jgi:hypothetical protein